MRAHIDLMIRQIDGPGWRSVSEPVIDFDPDSDFDFDMASPSPMQICLCFGGISKEVV